MSVNYTKLAKEVAVQQNKVRTNPKSFIPILEKYMTYFKGLVFHKPGLDYGVDTQEGKTAIQECISFLKKQKALDEIKFDDAISKAALDHANDIGPNGICAHSGTDGSTTSQRIERYVEWDATCGENIDFGATTGEEVILSLIVDDGVPDRGHRKNIFSTSYGFCGVGSAEHSEYGICTIIDYTGGINGYVGKGKSSTSSKPQTTKPTYKVEEEEKSNKKTNTKSHYPSTKLDPKKDENLKALRDIIQNRSKGNTIVSKNQKNVTSDFGKITLDDPFKDDEDAPEGAVSVAVKTTTKTTSGKTVKKTIKTYTLNDGSKHILELEETSY